MTEENEKKRVAMKKEGRRESREGKEGKEREGRGRDTILLRYMMERVV